MRRRIAVAAAGIGVAAALLPVAPASAFCNPVTYEVLGICNPCSTVGGVYNAVDRALLDLLPDLQCLA